MVADVDSILLKGSGHDLAFAFTFQLIYTAHVARALVGGLPASICIAVRPFWTKLWASHHFTSGTPGVDSTRRRPVIRRLTMIGATDTDRELGPCSAEGFRADSPSRRSTVGPLNAC